MTTYVLTTFLYSGDMIPTSVPSIFEAADETDAKQKASAAMRICKKKCKLFTLDGKELLIEE
jgi:hypothetical protein